MAEIKVLVAEENGVEYPYPTERILHSEDAKFNPTGTSLISTYTNSAIVEVYNLISTISSKFFLLAHYGASASTGRYLEFHTSIPSNEAPILFANSGTVTDIVLRTTATSATGTLGFYDIRVPASPVLLYQISLTAQKEKVVTGDPIFSFTSGTLMACKIDSGTIAKPHIQIGGRGG